MDSPHCCPQHADEATSRGDCGNTLTACAHTLTWAPAAPPEDAEIPTSFATGRYQVRRFVGEGSKEGAYLAHDIRFARDLAIALSKTANSDEPDLACPRREAQAIGRLGVHLHIATVYDNGEEDGQLYFMSEYMEGSSIDELLQVVSERQQ
jgi:serine/threonine protein kinase